MNDNKWSYFRLEFKESTPFFGISVSENEETLYLDDSNEIVSNKNDDYREINYLLKGSFLIVQKGSKINNLTGDFDHYGGIHNKGSNNDYKDLINRIINAVK